MKSRSSFKAKPSPLKNEDSARDSEGRVDSSSQALSDTLVSERKPNVIKKCEDDVENAQDEDLMYELAGFDAIEKPKVTGSEVEVKRDDNYQIILRTLSRYNCSKIAPLSILEQMNPTELLLF
jgi:hypothetical protein